MNHKGPKKCYQCQLTTSAPFFQLIEIQISFIDGPACVFSIDLSTSSRLNMIPQLVCLVLLVSSGHSFVTQRTVHISANLIANYTGPFPGEKLLNQDQVSIINCNITSGGEGEAAVFPQLKVLDIQSTSLGDIPDGLLGAFPNLKTLVIKKTTIENFKLEDLNAIPSLQSLEIENIDLNILKENSLNKLTELKTLTLNHAKIGEIQGGAFNGLTNLEVLTLKNDGLKTISKEVLKPLKKLKELYLQHNELNKFGPDNVPELPELRKVDLGTNPVEVVDVEGLKKTAPKLEDVTVGATD